MHALTNAIEFDHDLLQRMDKQGPRYTSYPTADRFTPEFGLTDYREAIEKRRTLNGTTALSVYVHVPFCKTLCYYCGCNKIVTKDYGKAEVYLEYLLKELALQAQLYGRGHKVEQLHWGGGTPTYLKNADIEKLMSALGRSFNLADDASSEIAIEIDPRTVDFEKMTVLRAQGFNRVSLGVQDFDPIVQKAVNRIQSVEQTQSIIDASRQLGFRSVSIDLIYGLPKQNVITFNQTLRQVIQARPDRVAIYNYAHMPHIFKPQRRIDVADIPSPETKLDLLHLSIKRLSEAGYVYIGMDHFALPEDSLAIAQRQGRLRRNFQGYSTHAGLDVVGLGVSAIGSVGANYAQNAKDLESYCGKLDQGEIPIVRGLRLSMDDLIRRSVINQLMCQFELCLSSVEEAYPIQFAEYFSAELKDLKTLEADGLLHLDDDWITVTIKGRLLIRNICMVFDRYLRQVPMSELKYSRTV